MKLLNLTRWSVPLVALLMLTSMTAIAGPYGFDLHNVLSPKAAGMAGTTIAGDSTGPVEAVFGNPANLTDFQGGTDFTFGATIYYPEALVEQSAGPNGNAEVLGGAIQPFRTQSSAEAYAVPQIAVTQDLAGVGVPVVLGLGLSVVSGIGVDYRQANETLGAGAELIFLGVNAGAGYEFNEKLDLGAALTITYGMLEAGVAGSNAQSHDYGWRLTLGGDYHLTNATDVGFYYQTKLRHTWEDSILQADSPTGANASFEHLTMEQPANIALGVSHKFSDNFRVMADVIHKNWSETQFWRHFYHDQMALSLGAEFDQGPITWRAGYGYANDPNRDAVAPEALNHRDFVCVGSPLPGTATCLPLTGAGGAHTWTFLQALETPVIYEQRVSVGMTWDGFLAPFLALDAHLAYQIQKDRRYEYAGVDDYATQGVSSIHGGFALNWHF